MTNDTTHDGSNRNRTDDGSRTFGIAERLRERSVRLDTTDPAAGTEDLRPLQSPLGDARVVALGEATHGTREFFRLKHRLFAYLVTEMGYRLFGLEANFSETLAIDDYVRYGEGDPKEALAGIYFWTWDTEEVLALIEWIREFNRGRDEGDRVGFYGLDVQFTMGPARALGDYLDENDPALPAKDRETLEALATDGLSDQGEETDAGPLRDAERLVSALGDRLDRREDEYVAATSRQAYELVCRHRWTLERAVEHERAKHDDGLEAMVTIRDRAMAEMVPWILDHEDRDRIALWAHNEHVKSAVRENDWGRADPMGLHLRREFGDGYYALGFDFGRGSFQALGEVDDGDGAELREWSLADPPADAAARFLLPLESSILFIDVDSLSADELLAEWLDEPTLIRSLGARYYGEGATDSHHDCVRLSEAFDGLLFVERTTMARPIDRS